MPTRTNPRLDAMRAELRELEEVGLTAGRERRRRAAILRDALRAYRTDAELEAAEAEARRCRGATARDLDAMRAEAER